tara:strand:+ start:15 stop:515 length:501 start_codon:yes stop_codon:yes gene_type:complete
MKHFKETKSISPALFVYADRFSVRADSQKDLMISHKSAIVGKDSLSRKPYPGDQSLVVAKKADGYYIFSAKVTDWVEDEDRKDIWYKQGGNRWKINYDITDATDPIFLTKKEVQEITGASDKEMSRIFVDQWGTDDPNSKIAIIGEHRQKLFDYLKNNLTNSVNML